MKHVKFIPILVGVVFISTLQGCDTSSSKVGSQATSLSTVNNPIISKDTFVFKDAVDYKIKSVTVTSLEAPTVVIYQSILNCKKTCEVEVPEDKIIGENLLFTFTRGVDGKNVAGYVYLHDRSRSSLKLSNSQLGHYIFNKMKENNKTYLNNPFELNYRLDKFFSAYGSNRKIIVLLGGYYKLKVVHGNLSEKEFYHNLDSDLSKQIILSKDLIQLPTSNADIQPANLKTGVNSSKARAMMSFKSAASADSSPSPQLPPFISQDDVKSMCGSEDNSAISMADGLLSLSSLIPGIPGMALSSLFDLGRITLLGACPIYNDLNIMKSIELLSGRVDELDKQMVSLNYSIDTLSAEILEGDNKSIKDRFIVNMTKFEDGINVYRNNFDGSNGKAYPSLTDFVNDHNGGVKDLVDVAQNLTFIKTLTNMRDQQMAQFYDILNDQDITDLETNLYKMYNDEKSITGEIISGRIKADVLLNFFVSKMSMVSVSTKLMLLDEINVIVSALKSGNIDQEWLNKKGIGTFYTNTALGINVKWEDATVFIRDSLIEKKLKFISENLVGTDCKPGAENLVGDVCTKMYPPLRGFPADLFSNLKSKCESTVISEWRIKTADNDSYIVTSCPMKTSRNQNMSDGSLVEDVKSSYYLSGGESMNSILGVFVPSNSVGINSTPQQLQWTDLGTKWGGTDDTGVNIFYNFLFAIRSDLPLHKNSTTAVNSFGSDGKFVPKSLSVVLPDEKDELNNPNGSGSPAYHSYQHNYSQGADNLIGWPANVDNALAGMSGPINYDGQYTYYNSHVGNMSTPLDSAVDVGWIYYYNVYNEVMYFSFKQNGYTYLFGLGIHNYINRSMDYYFVGDNAYYNRAEEDVYLQCIDKTLCSIADNKIIWKDGTYASMSLSTVASPDGYRQVNLSFGHNEVKNK